MTQVEQHAELQDFYATAYVRVRAATEAEAVERIEGAYAAEEEHEAADGVFLTVCGGPWQGIEPVDEPECICPPEMDTAGGSFWGGCPVHNP